MSHTKPIVLELEVEPSVRNGPHSGCDSDNYALSYWLKCPACGCEGFSQVPFVSCPCCHKKV
jgi:hypothetical protein